MAVTKPKIEARTCKICGRKFYVLVFGRGPRLDNCGEHKGKDDAKRREGGSKADRRRPLLVW